MTGPWRWLVRRLTGPDTSAFIDDVLLPVIADVLPEGKLLLDADSDGKARLRRVAEEVRAAGVSAEEIEAWLRYLYARVRSANDLWVALAVCEAFGYTVVGSLEGLNNVMLIRRANK